ncbi:MAG: hypothetical protein JXA06_09765 [Bacteroidetes bacterium]|nr:hypothetical protein [Bacteroidota bacterium]
MKLFWWITGAVFTVASSVLIVRYIAENEEKIIYHGGNDKRMNSSKSPNDIYESEFQETEFVV